VKVVVIVRLTGRLSWIRAIVLMVWHCFFVSELATEGIEAIDSDADEALAVVDEIFADHIASVRKDLMAESYELAVSVLSKYKSTL
jgi:hypothetical protein